MDALAPLQRRAFLRFAGVVAATTLLPSGCSAVSSDLRPLSADTLSVLSPRAYATFQAFSMRLAGPGLAREIRARNLDPAGVADAWVARRPALGDALGQGLVVLEWAVWPLLPKWRPFTSLHDTGQDRVLASLAASRMDLLRDLYRGLKSLATLALYTQPAVRRSLGAPDPFDVPGIALALRELPRDPKSSMKIEP